MRLMSMALVLGLSMAGTHLLLKEPPVPVQVAPSSETLQGLIARHEAGARRYNAYNRGSGRCGLNRRVRENITSMTIREIQKRQRLPRCHRSKLFALGGHQVIPGTLNKAVRSMGLSRNERFTPRLQDRIFEEYLTVKKRPAIHRYITTGRGQQDAGVAMALEWAAMKSPKYYRQCWTTKHGKRRCVTCRKNRGCYDGVGWNKGGVSAKRVMQALANGRNIYVKQRAAGVSHKTAYARALGVNR